jgi:hypothetical protein
MKYADIPAKSHYFAEFLIPKKAYVRVVVRARSDVDAHITTDEELQIFRESMPSSFYIEGRSSREARNHSFVVPWPRRQTLVVIIVNRSNRSTSANFDVFELT